MFEPTSRYYTLDTAILETPDGRKIKYKRRRFLPQAENMQIGLDVTIKEGDRLDLIAANLLGDPEQYWQICDANNTMNPFQLTTEIGRTLHIAIPQFPQLTTGNTFSTIPLSS